MKTIIEHHPNPFCFTLHIDKRLPEYDRYGKDKPDLVGKIEDVDGVVSISFHDIFAIQIVIGHCFNKLQVQEEVKQVVTNHFDVVEKSVTVVVANLTDLGLI